MTKLNTLRDALIEELKDLYSAETQLVKALPKLQKNAVNKRLKQAIHSHLKETEGHVARLERIGQLLGEKLTGKTCHAMQGLIAESDEIMKEQSDNLALVDALMIGAAQRVEHYEIAGYGTARAFAEELDEPEVVELLTQTLDEEAAADETLSSISEEEVLMRANSFTEVEESDVANGKSTTTSKKRAGTAARLLLVVLVVTFGALTAKADPIPKPKVDTDMRGSYAANNSGINSRDRESELNTADRQSMSGRNVQVLAAIRRQIVANHELSTDAHNVKIMVENGVVTLRGPVRSAQEREWIANTTNQIASGFRVQNKLEIINE